MRTIVLLVYLQVMLSVYFILTVGSQISLQCMKSRIGDINLQFGININHPLRAPKIIRNVNYHMSLCEVKYFTPRMDIL
jgi:hypothetical protein